jgi:hypothetical protein
MTALRCTKSKVKKYLGVQCEVSEKVALRINQEERDKLEGRLRRARLSTAMDRRARLSTAMDHMSVTSRSSARSFSCHQDQGNIKESFSFDGIDPLEEESEDDPVRSANARKSRPSSKGDLYEVPETVEAHHGPENNKEKKKKQKSKSSSNSTSKRPSKRPSKSSSKGSSKSPREPPSDC